MRRRTAAVVRVELTRPLEAVGPTGHDEVLLVVSVAGRVIGQTSLESAGAIEPGAQWRAIVEELGDEALGALASRRIRQVAGVSATTDPLPSPAVSVIVCTRGRPEALDACLRSIAELRTEPADVVVVDNSEGDARVASICERHRARCVVEPVPGHTRARNRGLLSTDAELVAFTDDDCVVDAHWLDRLGDAFADRMVMCVTGYIGPLELDTPAQYLFERHGGFERRPRRTVFDITRKPPVLGAAIAGAGANMIFRREVFGEIGNFAEDLGAGTPARSSDDKYAFYRLLDAGYRIVYEPDRVVWHRHRASADELWRTFNDYGRAELAYTTRCLTRHRDLSAVHVQRWWLGHIAREIAGAVRPGGRDLPVRLALEELRGALGGPRALRASARSRRGIEPLPAPSAARAPVEPPRIADELPDLSVAVATHNRRDGLRRLLESLGAQTLGPDRFEVVVVVDGSSDGSADMARTFHAPYAVRVIEQPRRGLAATRNRGAREAANPVVVFLDDDMEAHAGALAAHATAHARASERHYALGYFPPAISSRELWPLSLRLWWEDHFRRKGSGGHAWSFLDVVDGNSSIHVAQLLELGGFDERFAGGRRQDYDLGVRMLASGTSLAFHREAAATHHLDVSLEKAIANAREEGRYDVLLAQLHPEVKERLLLRLVRERLAPRRRARMPSAGTVARLRRLEAVRRRRMWRAVLDDALLGAYTVGAAEACGGIDALADLVGEEAPAQVESLRLDPGAERPSFTASRQVELRVSLGDRTLAAVEGTASNRQWDWEVVLQRVEKELAEHAERPRADAILDLAELADEVAVDL